MNLRKIYIVLWAFLTGLASCGDDEGQRSYFTIEGNPATLYIGQEAYSKTWSISANTEWKFVNRSGQTWASVTPSKGTGNGSITIIAEANQGIGRTALFDIVANGVENQQIAIVQGEVYHPDEESEFPIVAWSDNINTDVTLTRFPTMKACGMNIYLDVGNFDNLNALLKALDDAQTCNIKLIASCPELKSNTETTIKALMNKPALYGYYLDDEPELSEIQDLALLTAQIQAIDSKHPCYINLYPNWIWGGAAGYAANVKAFLEQTSVPFLSFDYYPIFSPQDGVPSTLHPDWYRNLEDIASAAKKKGIPFWAFALALSHSTITSFYPVPTIAELRLQVFSNLAYGAQGIQYFTYWGLYHDAPTIVYDRVKTVNQEIQNLSSVFLHASVISVWHTGAQLPNGTRPIDKLPAPVKSLTTSDEGAVVSLLEKGDSRYLAIVNHDYKNPMTLTVSLESSVKQVQKTGSITEANSGTIQVDAGDIIIYTWKK
jgi:hypothetical protein